MSTYVPVPVPGYVCLCARRVCVCVCTSISVCGRMCHNVCVCVFGISQWTRLPFIWLIPGPSWQEAVREGTLSDGARDKHTGGGENILFILGISRNMQRTMGVHVHMLAGVCVSVLVEVKHFSEIERMERHLEKKKGNALNSVCISPEQHYNKAATSLPGEAFINP